MSNTTLLVILGVAAVGVYVYTRPTPAATTAPAAPQQPAYPYPYYPQASQNPANLNNYYPNQNAQYIAATGQLLSGLGSAVGSIVGAAT